METLEKLGLLVDDILAKRELSNLEDEYVMEKLQYVFNLEKNRKAKAKFEETDYSQFRRSKEFKQVLKEVRANLREVYGVFITDEYKKRQSFLEELGKDGSLENHNRILELHRSSKERMHIYPVIYKKIFEHTGVPKKILDLACGLNPISYPYLECTPEYTACDLSDNDLEFIQSYFRIMKIKGKTEHINLTSPQGISRVSKLSAGVDITFLFKALDSLEAVEWDSSEKLLKKIKSTYIVISFATMSIGGRKEIKKERRSWVDKMLKRNHWEYSEIDLPGEAFYVVKKQ